MSMFWCQIERDLVAITGSDARSFLHSQLSQDIAGMSAGESRASLLLQPTGKIDAIVRVTCNSGESFIIDTDQGWGHGVIARLQRFKIRVKADINMQSQTCIAYRGCSGNPYPGALPAWRGDGSAWDVFGDVADPNIKAGSVGEYEEMRIRAAWPLMGRDVTTDMIPGETGITDCAVSFTKGCYPGQELVERMDSRGTSAPRSLHVIDATAGATAGSEVLLGGAVVGMYTSVAGPVGLALIKRGTDITRL